MSVERRLPEHKIAADLACLHAIAHEADVVQCGMLSSMSKALLHGFKTKVVTFQTQLDAVAHPLVVVVFHWGLLFGNS
jgi:hypothetical protein